jgi:hypothetical protein
LTVTDGGGLSTTDVHFLYPNCLALAPVPSIVASVEHGPSAFTSTLDASGSVDNGIITSFAWDFGDGSFCVRPRGGEDLLGTGGLPCDLLTVTDNDGLASTAEKVITVYDLSPPACPGSSGSILRQYWTGISGTAVSALLNNSAYPDQPSGTTYPTSIRGPVNFGDNYGTRMRGYIIPPVTGGYTFNITSDDASVFYLSPNADPAFKESICSVPGWTNDTEYGKYASQQSGTMQLTAGTWYYFEFIQKEGGGGDHMTVRWTQPGNGTLTVVGGTAVAQWADCPPNLSLRMVLGGPYDAATGLMKDDLRAAGLIPALEPYTALGYLQVGGGGETVAPATLAITGKNAMVDWVLVELRDQLDPAVVVATRCALLQRDGDVVGTDGHAALTFGVPAGNYYVAARHRNHLGVMTATPVAVRSWRGRGGPHPAQHGSVRHRGAHAPLRREVGVLAGQCIRQRPSGLQRIGERPGGGAGPLGRHGAQRRGHRLLDRRCEPGRQGEVHRDGQRLRPHTAQPGRQHARCGPERAVAVTCSRHTPPRKGRSRPIGRPLHSLRKRGSPSGAVIAGHHGCDADGIPHLFFRGA